jgi:hypothetical protein
MQACIEQSNGLASLSPFQSWPDCIINTPDMILGKDRASITALKFGASPKNSLLCRRNSLFSDQGISPLTP